MQRNFEYLATTYPEKKNLHIVKEQKSDLNVCNNFLSSDITRWVVLIY